MNVFELRDRLTSDYSQFVRSFISIRDKRSGAKVDAELGEGLLWPEPLIQLNPSFQLGENIDELVDAGILHEECRRVFLRGKDSGGAKPLLLYTHQAEAIKIAQGGHSYVLTTGTGSGKSLAYIIPIVDHVLRHGSGRGIQAIVVYPMNALANSQMGELEKFLCAGYPDRKGPVTFARYTGQESNEEKDAIIANPPDILLTNYVMLELVLTRPEERALVRSARGLRFLVLDELHTYRGRQGADVAMLVRRARDAFATDRLQCVGTSATLAGSGTYNEQRAEVAHVTSMIFGAPVQPEHVIGETLRRTTPERDLSDPNCLAALRTRLEDPDAIPPRDFQGFTSDPLSIWIESSFGVTVETGTGRLIPSELRQSIEAGSAYWNEFSLRKRFKQLLGGLRAESQKLITKGYAQFLEHVILVRNYLTHYTAQLEQEVRSKLQGNLPSGEDYFYLNWRLKAWLTLILLKDLGIPEDQSVQRMQTAYLWGDFLSKGGI